MDLSTMISTTQLLIDDVNAERFTTTEITTFINAAQSECQKLIDEADEGYFSSVQKYNVVPTTTSLEFELPADFKKLILAEGIIGDGDPIPARIVPFGTRHELHDMQDVAVVPCVYFRGTKLGVVEPTSTYTLRVWYTKRIPDLSATTDVSAIPIEYHHVVCLYAAKLATISESKAVPPGLQTELQETLSRMGQHIESRQLQTPRTVHYVAEDFGD